MIQMKGKLDKICNAAIIKSAMDEWHQHMQGILQ